MGARLTGIRRFGAPIAGVAATLLGVGVALAAVGDITPIIHPGGRIPSSLAPSHRTHSTP